MDEAVSNDDLLTEMLLRLPIRTILRFKSVSKRWYALLSDPNFVLCRSRIPNLDPPLSGLFIDQSFIDFVFPPRQFPARQFDFVPLGIPDDGDDNNNQRAAVISKPPFKSLTFANNSVPMKLIDSSNGGLMLCHPDPKNMFESGYKFYVYNPTTNSFRVLPKFNFDGGERLNRRQPRSATIAFNPSKSPHYRVILFWGSQDGYLQVEIYSSETRTWNWSGANHRESVRFKNGNGVYWNDAIHWMDFQRGILLYFKLDEERFYELRGSPPAGPGHGGVFRYVFESRDCLLLFSEPVVDDSHAGRILYNVYEMKRDYSQWPVKYCIELDIDRDELTRVLPGLSEYEDLRPFITILHFVLGENEDDSFLIFQIPGKIMRYNLVSKTLKKLSDRTPCSHRGSFLFVESLSAV